MYLREEMSQNHPHRNICECFSHERCIITYPKSHEKINKLPRTVFTLGITNSILKYTLRYHQNSFLTANKPKRQIKINSCNEKLPNENVSKI